MAVNIFSSWQCGFCPLDGIFGETEDLDFNIPDGADLSLDDLFYGVCMFVLGGSGPLITHTFILLYALLKDLTFWFSLSSARPNM